MAMQSDLRASCAAELKRVEEDTTYSAKSQFEAARDWRRVHYALGLPAAIVGGVAGVSALSAFDYHNVVAGVLSLSGAALGAANAFLNPAERAASHQAFGNDYNALKNRSRRTANIDAVALTDEELAASVTTLGDERDKLNKKAPQPHRKAFERARAGIEAGEANYAVDTKP